MTSKEALEQIKHCGNRDWRLAIEDVEKKLEILDILKKIIKNNVFDVAMLDDRPNGETYLSCEDYGITLKTEDYRKIMRWLNGKD